MNDVTHILYAVKTANDMYFAGFNAEKGVAIFTADPFKAKLFSNKNDIRLRPQETIVPLTVTINSSTTQIGTPFRPSRPQR